MLTPAMSLACSIVPPPIANTSPFRTSGRPTALSSNAKYSAYVIVGFRAGIMATIPPAVRHRIRRADEGGSRLGLDRAGDGCPRADPSVSLDPPGARAVSRPSAAVNDRDWLTGSPLDHGEHSLVVVDAVAQRAVLTQKVAHLAHRALDGH